MQFQRLLHILNLYCQSPVMPKVRREWANLFAKMKVSLQVLIFNVCLINTDRKLSIQNILILLEIESDAMEESATFITSKDIAKTVQPLRPFNESLTDLLGMSENILLSEVGSKCKAGKEKNICFIYQLCKV